jgi:hypothetical protein
MKKIITNLSSLSSYSSEDLNQISTGVFDALANSFNASFKKNLIKLFLKNIYFLFLTL